MIENDILANKLEILKSVISSSFSTASEQSQGFALRILGKNSCVLKTELAQFDLSSALQSSHYGGIPVAAYLGYGIGNSKNLNQDDFDLESTERTFFSALDRLFSREDQGLTEFICDEISVLGVADGLSVLSETSFSRDHFPGQLVKLIDQGGTIDSWASRLRALSAELIDGRGRLYERLYDDEPLTLALDICLRNCWPHVYEKSTYVERSLQQNLLKFLLTEQLPGIGDLEKAVVWFQAVDLLVQETITTLVPSTPQVVEILKNTQSSLKRWVWEESSRRKNSIPARWLIDNEYHVQSLLWTILYPIFGENLVDETVLPGYGLLQPRADFGITNLKLIIELKILREKRDFESVEEGIAGDLGIYFSELHRFNRMIAYIYDDCDKHYPELYDILRNALKKRDSRIEDILIVRRPSMIPSRKLRNP